MRIRNVLAPIRGRRGSGLIDAIVTMFLVGTLGLAFSAMYPAASSCSRQAQEYKIASGIAQEKMERLRSLKYELLTPAVLTTSGVIDPATSGTQFTFTTVDRLTDKLAQGAGLLQIDSETQDMKKVTVRVSWVSSSHSVPRSVELTSYITDMRTRKAY
jgi:Tfp pilus assembly protein PilV